MASRPEGDSSAVDKAVTAGRPGIPMLTWVVVAILGLIGCLASSMLSSMVQNREDEVIQTRFELAAEHRVGLLRQQFASAAALIESVAAFYDGSERVEPYEFRAFTSPLIDDTVELVGWAELCTADDRDAHEKLIRETRLPQYEIRELSAQGLRRAADRGEYFPIQYLVDAAQGAYLIGLDINALPELQRAIANSRSTKAATAVSVALPNAKQNLAQFLVIVAPVIRNSSPGSQESAVTDGAFHGVVLAAFRIDKLVEAAIGGIGNPVGIDLRLYESRPDQKTQLVFQRASRTRPSDSELEALQEIPSDGDGGYVTPFEVADATWNSYQTAVESFGESQRTAAPKIVFWIGVAFCGLVGGLSLIEIRRTLRLRNSNQRLLGEIVERTRAEQAVRLEQSRLEALLQLNQMADAEMKKITNFALEEAVRLTQKQDWVSCIHERRRIGVDHARLVERRDG